MPLAWEVDPADRGLRDVLTLSKRLFRRTMGDARGRYFGADRCEDDFDGRPKLTRAKAT